MKKLKLYLLPQKVNDQDDQSTTLVIKKFNSSKTKRKCQENAIKMSTIFVHVKVHMTFGICFSKRQIWEGVNCKYSAVPEIQYFIPREDSANL